MELGKVSESVLKRSVLKYTQQNNKTVSNACQLINEANIGTDASLFAVSGAVMASATAVSIGRRQDVATEAVINACNNLVCTKAEPVAVQIALVLPEALYESELRHMMEAAKEYAKQHQLMILGGHTTVSKFVTETIATVTAFGYVKEDALLENCVPEAGMDIVMSKWIGLQGTAKLAAEQKEVLLKRLPARFISQAASYKEYMSITDEARIAMQQGVCMMHDVSGGGIFRALWELAEKAETGIRIELKKIPVKQETIEICEIFGLNPYELLAGGALLMVTPHGDELTEKLAAAGISSAVIGRLTGDNDRVIVTYGEDGEELRYLDRPRNDEIDKI